MYINGLREKNLGIWSYNVLGLHNLVVFIFNFVVIFLGGKYELLRIPKWVRKRITQYQFP